MKRVHAHNQLRSSIISEYPNELISSFGLAIRSFVNLTILKLVFFFHLGAN